MSIRIKFSEFYELIKDYHESYCDIKCFSRKEIKEILGIEKPDNIKYMNNASYDHLVDSVNTVISWLKKFYDTDKIIIDEYGIEVD